MLPTSVLQLYRLVAEALCRSGGTEALRCTFLFLRVNERVSPFTRTFTLEMKAVEDE